MNQWKPKYNFTKPIRNVRIEQNSQNFKNITQYSQNPKHKKKHKIPSHRAYIQPATKVAVSSDLTKCEAFI